MAWKSSHTESKTKTRTNVDQMNNDQTRTAEVEEIEKMSF